MSMLRWSVFLLALLFRCESLSAHTIQTYSASAIPGHITLFGPGIFNGSDSLYLNERLLIRDSEYVYDPTERSFDLTRISASTADTLTVIFSELPFWLGTTYGREIPEAIASTSPVPIPQEATSLAPNLETGQGIKLSGAKSFRFSAQNRGSNDFGQTLDLKITGELSPGLTLTGALSDRGYDPAYGTATTRLNELDRLNLQLSSQRLLARIGDITLTDPFGGPNKNVSGVSAALSYPTWEANIAAARPRGRFFSISLTGQNGFQGPYQIGVEGTAGPVVPGSERVYLDGRALERGSDKDYTVDYPAGQITFGVRNPIDRRSRIEIDYEPLATTYRQELLAGRSGVAVGDSTFSVIAEVLREGDDREQLLLGDLTQTDKAILSTAGDADSYRSGIHPDTAGNYLLVTDSLPDSVFQYMGTRQGDYTVSFSFVGPGRGAYAFLGSDNYQYVGWGKGDYLPVVKIPRPERTDYYRSAINLSTRVGQIRADIRQSAYDKNLWSNLDDNNNTGLFYALDYCKEWQWNAHSNEIRLERKVREASFQERSRINGVDFNREHLLPIGYLPRSTELLHSAELTFSPTTWITLRPTAGQLLYRDDFRSSVGGMSLTLQPTSRLDVISSVRALNTELDTLATSQPGRGRNFSTSARYRLNDTYIAESGFEYDSRKNSYIGVPQGTRYDRWTAGLSSKSEGIRYERYQEDSLMPDWSRSAVRDRVTATSARKIGRLSYSAAATWQRLNELQSTENNFLGQTSLSYADTRHQLNVNTSYLVSEELRNARGVMYLEVEPGRGNYSFENGQYIPDQFGNFIQVEELLSSRARVRRGDKSFSLSKEWHVAQFRFSSSIQEELKEDGKRPAWWVVPFLTDEHQPYLFLARRYDATLRVLPWRSFYAVNIQLSDDIERRSIVETDRQRDDRKSSLTLKQAVDIYYIDESIDIFRTDRDQYYSGIGAVDGYRLAGTVRRSTTLFDLSAGPAYRHATSSQNDLAQTYSLLLGSRVKVFGQGELRTDLEIYRQDLSGAASDYSYQLTEAKYGKEGAIWTVGATYGIRQGVRLSLSFTGRHSDERPGRVTGRGEVVATF